MPSHRRHTCPQRRQLQRHQCYTKITLHIFTHSVSPVLYPLGHEGDFFNDSHRQPSILCTNGTHPLPLIFPKIFQLMFCTAHAYKDNEIIAKHKENAHSRHVNKCLIYYSAHFRPPKPPIYMMHKES